MKYNEKGKKGLERRKVAFLGKMIKWEWRKRRVWNSSLYTSRASLRILSEDINEMGFLRQGSQQGFNNSKFFLKLVSWRLKNYLAIIIYDKIYWWLTGGTLQYLFEIFTGWSLILKCVFLELRILLISLFNPFNECNLSITMIFLLWTHIVS